MTRALIRSQRLTRLSHQVAPPFSFSSQQQLVVLRLKLSVQVSILFSGSLDKKKKIYLSIYLSSIYRSKSENSLKFGFLGKNLYESMALEETWHPRNLLSFTHGFQPLP